MPQLRWKGQFCKQNKLDKSSNFTVNAKYAIEGQGQSRSCFESKVGEGFRLIDLSFWLSSWEEIAAQSCKTVTVIWNLRIQASPIESFSTMSSLQEPTHIQHMVEKQHQFFNLVHVVF